MSTRKLEDSTKANEFHLVASQSFGEFYPKSPLCVHSMYTSKGV